MIDPLLAQIAADLPASVAPGDRDDVARAALDAVNEVLAARQVSAARLGVDYDAMAAAVSRAKTAGARGSQALAAVCAAHLEPALQRARQHIEIVEQDRRRALAELERRARPTWAGLMRQVDDLYPAESFTGGDGGDGGDGPRVVALLREIDRLKTAARGPAHPDREDPS